MSRLQPGREEEKRLSGNSLDISYSKPWQKKDDDQVQFDLSSIPDGAA